MGLKAEQFVIPLAYKKSGTTSKKSPVSEQQNELNLTFSHHLLTTHMFSTEDRFLLSSPHNPNAKQKEENQKP